MGKVIYTTDIERESGYLYYCGTDENGLITVCQAKMGRGKKKSKAKAKKK